MRNKILHMVITCAGIASIGAESSPGSLTINNAMVSYQAINKVYWDASRKLFYKDEARTKVLDFWLTAHSWDMVMDVWNATGSAESRRQITDIYDGFIAKRGLNWTETNSYNDDVMWWVISCARAFRLTGESRYQLQAKSMFDKLYQSHYDTHLGGGFYWSHSHKEKNSCINSPGVIAAMNLLTVTGEQVYLRKAQEIYAWQKKTLVDTSGAVWDHIESTGAVDKRTFSYNQGTFIGAAVLLCKVTGDVSYIADAKRTADWTRANMCNKDGIFLNEGQGDGGAFKHICVRYIIDLTKQGGQKQYMQWMLDNANAAWDNRRKGDDIMGFDWAAPAGSGIECQSATGGVALLHMLIPDGLSGTPAFSLNNVKAPNRTNRAITGIAAVNIAGKSLNAEKFLPYTTIRNNCKNSKAVQKNIPQNY